MNFNFLFWNLRNKQLETNISKLSTYFNANLLMLCECKINNIDLLLNINQKRTSNLYHFITENDRGIKIFSTYKNTEFEVISSNVPEVIVLRIISVNVLVFVVHLPSKMHYTKDALFTSGLIIKEIKRIETQFYTSKTMIMGDFNVNPFEKAMVDYNGFNAVMTMEIAKTKYRKIANEKYEYFYNPMWSFLGDLSNFSAGTFFHTNNDVHNHYRWNMLDQIIMKPDLIPFFNKNSIQIVNNDGVNQLKLSKTSKKHSDHFPIFCNFVF
jgi:hypothetical protein